MAYIEQEEKKYVCVDDVIDRLYDNEFAIHCPLDEVSDVIYNTPTADVVEVKHGYWVRNERKIDEMSEIGIFYTCSRCGTWGSLHQKYCSECGAKMDGGKKE